MKIPFYPIRSIQSLFKAYLTPSLEEEIEQCILLKQRSLIHAQQAYLLAESKIRQLQDELTLLNLWKINLRNGKETLYNFGPSLFQRHTDSSSKEQLSQDPSNSSTLRKTGRGAK